MKSVGDKSRIRDEEAGLNHVGGAATKESGWLGERDRMPAPRLCSADDGCGSGVVLLAGGYEGVGAIGRNGNQ